MHGIEVWQTSATSPAKTLTTCWSLKKSLMRLYVAAPRVRWYWKDISSKTKASSTSIRLLCPIRSTQTKKKEMLQLALMSCTILFALNKKVPMTYLWPNYIRCTSGSRIRSELSRPTSTRCKWKSTTGRLASSNRPLKIIKPTTLSKNKQSIKGIYQVSRINLKKYEKETILKSN